MNKKAFKMDIVLFIILFILFIISLLSIQKAQIFIPIYYGNIVLKQFIWYICGIITVLLIVKLKNEFLLKYGYLIYFINILLLLFLLIFGDSINGSKCWINILDIFSFQPSEFMKISLILVLTAESTFFMKKDNSIKNEFIYLIKTLFIVLLPSVLTFLQPDTGAVIIYLFIYLLVIFIKGIKKRWLFLGLSSLTSSLSLLFYLYFFQKSLFLNFLGTDFFYRIERILLWQQKSGFQLENSIISIGSSGFFGQNKLSLYFPEASTDFIFSSFASGYGFTGVFVILIFFLTLDLYIILLAIKRINKKNDTILLIGCLGYILYPQIQNISMTIGLMPINGVALPFISYGGSSIIATSLIIGIILNISNKEKNSL